MQAPTNKISLIITQMSGNAAALVIKTNEWHRVNIGHWSTIEAS